VKIDEITCEYIMVAMKIHTGAINIVQREWPCRMGSEANKGGRGLLDLHKDSPGCSRTVSGFYVITATELVQGDPSAKPFPISPGSNILG